MNFLHARCRPRSGRLAQAEGRATPTSLDVGGAEDVTQAHLGDASRFEPAAFKTACLEDILDAHVEPWTAIAVVYDAGTWREGVAGPATVG